MKLAFDHPRVLEISRAVRAAGGRAYLVGGLVRDRLMGIDDDARDVDLEVYGLEGAALRALLERFGRVNAVGEAFTVYKIGDIDVSIPRRDSKTGKGHRGFTVTGDPTMTEEEACRRRDFTINGLFFDLDADQVIDYVEGQKDLEQHIVRTIGDPDIRFREDPVRILRAIKFAARLDFAIEPATYSAILEHRGEIAKCAPPRVLEEIYRLLRGGAARRSFELLVETDVLTILIPDLPARPSARSS